MSLRVKTAGVLGFLLAACCALSGCTSSLYNLSWLVTEGTNFNGKDLEYYHDQATNISYPDVSQPTDDRVFSSQRPRTLKSLAKDELWDLQLGDAIRLALKNSTFIRDRAQFLSPGNSIMNNSAFAPSKFDIGLQNTSVISGRRSVNAALADFDTRIISRLIWGRNETVQNNPFQNGLVPGGILTDETADAGVTLDKQLADSSTISVINDWNYSLNNVPSRLFGSVYTGAVRFNYTRPLWAAAGTRFTRIAGHPGRDATTALNVDGGVVIARINADISVADFEFAVGNMLRDVETLYWDLYFAYQTYHYEVKARDRAADVWSKISAKAEFSSVGLADEAQARDNFYDSKERAQISLADIYSTELQLRRMLGLPVNDGKVIRPADALETGELTPDWNASLIEALTKRVELRKQKWNIKSLQLQLEAARSLTNPRVDFRANYRINAFGDRFLDSSDNDGLTTSGFGSAVGSLTQGSQTGWELGFVASMPLGFRQAWSQVRNIELRLSKARKALSEQELEISHELSSTFQQLERWYASARTNFNRVKAAKDRLEAYNLLQETSNVLDAVVRAQFSLSQAQIAYLRSITEYNKAIAEHYYRKGAVFQRYNVILEEGEWQPEAYQDVLRRAWSRTHAFEEESTLRTEPFEFELDQPMPLEIPGKTNPEQELNFDKPGSILPPAPTIKETLLEIEKHSKATAQQTAFVPENQNAFDRVDSASQEKYSTPPVFPRQQNYNTKQNQAVPIWLKESQRRNQSSRQKNIPTYPNPAPQYR